MQLFNIYICNLQAAGITLEETCNGTKIFRRKDGSLDRFIEIKTTLAQIRRVSELKSIFGICLHLNSKNNTLI